MAEEAGPPGTGDADRSQEDPRPGDADLAPPPGQDAASAALARARAAAVRRGLRPGSRPLRTRTGQAPARDDRDGRDPTMLGDAMVRLVSDRGWEIDLEVGSVMGRWPQIVGPEVAAHCVPVTYQDGVLTVRAESTAWATQLRLLASSLLGRIEAEAGPGTVTELRITGPSGPSWTHGPRRVSDGRGPRDTYG